MRRALPPTDLRDAVRLLLFTFNLTPLKLYRIARSVAGEDRAGLWKLNEAQFKEIRDRLKSGESYRSIACRFNVSHQTIFNIAHDHDPRGHPRVQSGRTPKVIEIEIVKGRDSTL